MATKPTKLIYLEIKLLVYNLKHNVKNQILNILNSQITWALDTEKRT